MARQKQPGSNSKRQVENYVHSDKHRTNNPPVGLVTPDLDPDSGSRTYEFDPHLDPQLHWAGKAEHTSFDVPTVSLHVHERIDPKTIIDTVKKRNGSDPQISLFGEAEEILPLRQAIEFYKHKHNWTNRLIAGDSLLVMNSLIEKEGMLGHVQTVFFDPPYGIRYGSNFQPFVNKRDVKDGKDDDLTQEPEMIRAFRDTWELGIHSYLTYLRDRLLLARDLLQESGSCFVQISDENLHHVRELMDEVFGQENFSTIIVFTKAAGGLQAATRVGVTTDFIVWYFKDKSKAKYRSIYERRNEPFTSGFTQLEEADGTRRPMTREEKQKIVPLPEGSKPYMTVLMTKPGPGSKYEVEFEGTKYNSGNRWWGTTPEGMQNVIDSGRVVSTGKNIRYVTYFDDFPYRAITNLWSGFGGAANPVYVVQTNREIVKRCILMTSDPGDLVLDPTCGSGTTSVVAEQWGRRWITCDTSRVALALTKQRLMTKTYDYFQLAHSAEGISSGFVYKTVPHVTLKSFANKERPQTETLYDQPLVDRSKVRVTGPFTVEAVPSPVVKSVDEVEVEQSGGAVDAYISRTGETRRQGDWRDELVKTGIRGKGGQRIEFTRLEPWPGSRWLQAEGETKEDSPQRIVVSFGPEYAPMDQRQVALAIEEAQRLVPKPKVIVFAAFQFDPEAAKDIDETNWPGVNLLKAQMNADLLTDDLKRKRASNESFWLIGQPDIHLERIEKGDNAGKFIVSVNGFDYYNIKTGSLESGEGSRIAMWMLDTDYDGRSLFPRQVFFPMSSEKTGWSRLAKSLQAEIDEELVDSYKGTVSLPFSADGNKRAAVKIIDDRGIESLKIVELD